MPLSSSAIIGRDEVLELLDAARLAYPLEMQRARRVLQDHDELRLAAERQAVHILDEARSQAANLVQRTEIVRQARHEADLLVSEAESESRRIRHEAEDYVDRKLAAFEIVLDRTIRTVQAGRERLGATPSLPTEDLDGELERGDRRRDLRPGHHLMHEHRTRRDEVATRPFVVEVAALRRQPGSRRRVVTASGRFSSLEVSGSAFDPDEDVVFDAVLESVTGGILVSGIVRAPWQGECRRCLELATGMIEAEICELCVEHVDDEESYELAGDLLDLAPLARDACILELPLAPLCSTDCRGLCPSCGANRNLEPCGCGVSSDPRWASLAVLLGDRSGRTTRANE